MKILTDFLKSREQRVVLNSQHSSWSDALADVPQGSLLGPLLFLIYINDLSDGLQCNPKLFADDTSLFAIVHNIKKATNDLNNYLTKIKKWAFQWKMSFNPDISKQAHEIIFSRKRFVSSDPPLTFNSITVAQTNSQKHLGIQLDKKLNFEENLEKVESKVNKTIGRIIRKLQNVLPRSALLTIYKPFSRLQLDYGDIIYDKAFNESFHAKLESLQYNATLAITGAIRVSSTENIYEELGLESLKSRRGHRKMSFLYKVLKSESPSYLFNTMPNSNNRQHQTRNSGNILSSFAKHDYFKNSFFPSAITE